MSSYQEWTQCEYCGWEFANYYSDERVQYRYCPLCGWNVGNIEESAEEDLYSQASEQAEEELGKDADREEIEERTNEIYDELEADFLESEIGKEHTPPKNVISVAKKAIKELGFLGEELNEYLAEISAEISGVKELSDISILEKIIISSELER